MRHKLRRKTIEQAYYILKALKDLQNRLIELVTSNPSAVIEHPVLTRITNHIQELERLTTPVSVTPSTNTSIMDIEQTILAMTDIFYDLLLEDLDKMNVIRTRTPIGRNLIAANITIAGDLKNVMQQVDETLDYHMSAYLDENGQPKCPAYLLEKH